MLTSDGPATLEFGALRVDLRAFTVLRDGVRVDLEPKAFDLLALLVERRGELVTKHEILDRIWKDTAVTDNALTRIVAQLRKAIGDDAREAKYIETVPTRGYRWIASPAAGAVPPPEARPIGLDARPRAWLRPAMATGAIVLIAVAAALAFARRGAAGGAHTVEVLATTQVTVSRGLDAFPSFAPDGQTLVFASDRTGAFEIYTRSLDVSAAERALTADGQQNVQPSWSPDGAAIVYHSMGRGGIWVVPASGGAPRQVVPFGSHPQWSPDGRRIAFQSDELTDITPTAFGATLPSTIWIVDADGKASRQLTRQPRPVGGHAAPSWSPDGAHVVFAAYGAGATAVWAVGVDGGTPEQIFSGEKNVFEPQIASDGRWLYAATGSVFVMRLPLERGRLRPAGTPDWLTTPGVTASRHLRVSRDGQRFALAGLNLRSSLVTLRLDPGTRRPMGEAAPLAEDTSRRKTFPAFSPDGRYVAFTASRVGSGPDVWVFDMETGAETPITTGERTDAVGSMGPMWFPDGSRLGFLKVGGDSLSFSAARLTERRETPVLTLATPDRDARRAETLAGSLDFSLSPDGKTLAYSAIVRATGLPRIFLRALDGGPARPLTEGRDAENYPAWSPDGRQIAFELNKDNAVNVAVHPVEGGGTRQVTVGSGHQWVHSWAPDSDHVAVARLRNGVWNIWSVSVSTGDEQPLTSYTQPAAYVRYPAWSPRGDRVVYELGEVRGNVWVSRVP